MWCKGYILGDVVQLENGYVAPRVDYDGRSCRGGLEIAGQFVVIPEISADVSFDHTALAAIDGDGDKEVVLWFSRGNSPLAVRDGEYVAIASTKPALLLVHERGGECEELEMRTGYDSCLYGTQLDIGCDRNWSAYHRGKDASFEAAQPSPQRKQPAR